MVILALLVAGTVAAAGLIGFVYYKETHLPPIGDFDTIIVLGAQVKADGARLPSRWTQADGGFGGTSQKTEHDDRLRCAGKRRAARGRRCHA